MQTIDRLIRNYNRAWQRGLVSEPDVTAWAAEADLQVNVDWQLDRARWPSLSVVRRADPPDPPDPLPPQKSEPRSVFSSPEAPLPPLPPPRVHRRESPGIPAWIADSRPLFAPPLDLADELRQLWYDLDRALSERHPYLGWKSDDRRHAVSVTLGSGERIRIGRGLAAAIREEFGPLEKVLTPLTIVE